MICMKLINVISTMSVEMYQTEIIAIDLDDI